MLYMIFAQTITFGEFFSLWIYSFFIFGPLQSLGDVINTYREAETSLENFQQILNTPKDPKPINPTPVGNITTLLNELGENGLAGLIALGIILYLFHRRRIAEPNQQR